MRCPRCQRRLSLDGRCAEHPGVHAEPRPAPALPASLPHGLAAVAPLGEGGGGQVFSVRDARGERYALKLSKGSLQREAEALAALGAPRTPQLYAAGPDWLLMEQLEGRPLAERLAGTGPLEPGECLSLARRLAELLDAVHRRGWCHRDVKPENLWLRPSGEVALLDFGLARRLETPEGAARAGTAHYMAPEQHEGAAQAGAAADVYAVGVVLFELATGRLPFVGAADEVREAHLQRVAPPLSAYGVQWPSLAAVVAALLAKRPAERPDAAAALALLRGVSAEEALAAAPQAAPASAATAARRVALLGVRSAAPLPVLLEPVRREGGVLAAAVSGAFVFAFPEAPTVEAGLEAARRARAQLPEGQRAAVRAAPVQVRTLARSIRILGDALEDVSWVDSAVTRADAPAAELRAPLVGRARELAAARQALAGGRAVRFAGPAGIGKSRLYAELGEPGKPPLAPHGRDGAVVIELAPLSLDDSVALLRELMRPLEFVSRELLVRLASQAHGVPGLLVELVAALRRSGALAPDAQTGEWRLSAEAALLGASTPLLEQLAVSAVAGLPRDHQDLARLCAVLGEGSFEQLERAVRRLPRELGAATLEPREALGRLARAGLVELEADRFRFRQRVLAEALERSVPAALRRALHRAAFEAAGAPGAARARHAAAAGLWAEGQADFLDVAADAERACRDQQAEAMLSAALELPAGAPAQRAQWLWRRARARRRNQRFREAAADLELALSLQPEPELAAELHLERATVCDWSEDFAGSEAALAAAEALGRLAGSPRLELARGRKALRQGRWEEAAERLGAVAAAARAREPEVETVARLLAGAALAVLGRLAEAQAELDAALALARAREDYVHAGVALSNRVLLWLGLDRLDDAIDDLRESVRLAEAWGHPQNERWNSHNLAQFLLWLGRPAEALPLAERAHSLGRRFFGDALPPTATLLLARVALELGEQARARSLVSSLPRTLAPSDAAMARLLDLRLSAAPSEAEWLSLEPDPSLPHDDRIDLLLETARGLKAGGHHDAAKRRLEAARALVPSGTGPVWRRALDALGAL